MFSGLLGNGSIFNTGLAGSFLDKDQLAALNSQANKSALLTGALSYLAQPKNRNVGSAIPYLAQAGLQGYGMGQNVMNTAGAQALQLATLKKGMMTNLDKLVAARDALPANDPKRNLYNQAIEKETTHNKLVEVNTGTPFKEKFYEQSATKLMDSYENVAMQPVYFDNLTKVEKLIPDVKQFMGPQGVNKLKVVQFFNNNLGTNIQADASEKADEIYSRLFEQVKDNLKKMDATPTMQQQEKMERAFGSLNTDPNALKNIIKFQKEIIQNKVNLHNKKINALADETEFDYLKNFTVDLNDIQPEQTSEQPTQEATQTVKQDEVTNDTKSEPLNIFDKIKLELENRKKGKL